MLEGLLFIIVRFYYISMSLIINMPRAILVSGIIT